MSKKRIVVLSGAGISAESGISTFRDAGGLWEGHDVTEVASPEGWAANMDLVIEFYNLRRQNVLEAEPNEGHKALVDLESAYDVQVITQNVDDLHERAGSSNVLHLHGELLKVRSTYDEKLVYDWTKDLKRGDKCEKGYQLRPHIVWFGEMVPMLEPAARITRTADILIVTGTSLVVYPAASLVMYAPDESPKYIVDPNIPETGYIPNLTTIEQPATAGLRALADQLLENA